MFAILSSLIRVYIYTICHSQSDQCLQFCNSFLAVLSRFVLFALLSLIRFYSTYHYQQSDQGLHCLPFLAVWSDLHCFPFSENLPGPTLLAILSLIRLYTICHSQQFDQGLHYLPFSAVWSRSTLFSILSGLIIVYTNCHSQLSDQGLHYLPFWTVLSGSTLFAILSSLIMASTTCHAQQSDQGLYYLPFPGLWSTSRSTLSFSGTVWSWSTLFAILSCLIWVYTSQ